MVMSDEHDSYHSLLMDYAAGTLDEAYALAIAAHVALSPRARKIVSTFEGIGGGLLHDCCEPVRMTDDALARVLGKIESCCDTLSEECRKAERQCAEMALFPTCLQSYIEPDNDHLPWKETSPGYHTIALNTKCRKARATIIKIAPATTLPRPNHTGYALTLVLDGDYNDGTNIYERGELVILEERRPQTNTTGSNNGCICLAITAAPLSLFEKLSCLFRR